MEVSAASLEEYLEGFRVNLEGMIHDTRHFVRQNPAEFVDLCQEIVSQAVAGSPGGVMKHQVPTAHEKVLDRHPVSLRLCYKATSNRGPVQGFGQTRMMSSQDIVFAPADGLESGMNAEIVLGWPSFLNDYQLRLVLQVIITGSEDGVAEAQILAYHFRTAGAAETLGC